MYEGVIFYLYFLLNGCVLFYSEYWHSLSLPSPASTQDANQLKLTVNFKENS